MDIKRQMHERDFYLKKARRMNNDEDLATYRRLRNAVTYAIRQSKSRTNAKIFEKVFKNFSLSNKNLKAYMMNINGEKVTDKPTIANSVCTFFCAIGHSLQRQIKTYVENLSKQPTQKKPYTYKLFSFQAHCESKNF